MHASTSTFSLFALCGVGALSWWCFRSREAPLSPTKEKKRHRHLRIFDRVNDKGERESFFADIAETCAQLDKIPDDQILHVTIQTQGGSYLSCFRLLDRLKARQHGFHVYIRETCMSAGTFLALHAKEIVMKPHRSYLSKCEPQFFWQNRFISATHVKQASLTTSAVSLDEQLMLVYATAALNQISRELDSAPVAPNLRARIQEHFIDSELPHEQRFDYAACKELGLPVRLALPEEDCCFGDF